MTGASRGLGLAIATALHRAGYDVLMTDVDEDAVTAAAAPLGGWSARLDVRYDLACAAVAERAAERHGELALWVNNAGVLATGPSWTHDAATRRRVMEVNALGGMNGTMAALALMRPQRTGHVINVVSLAGLVAVPGESVYAASKHAMIAFSVGTLAELRAAGQKDVHVSCFCPGGIWTPMLYDKLHDASHGPGSTPAAGARHAPVARRAGPVARRVPARLAAAGQPGHGRRACRPTPPGPPSRQPMAMTVITAAGVRVGSPPRLSRCRG